MDEIFAVRRFKQVAISPDGQRVAWVQALNGAGGASNYVAPLSEPRLPAALLQAIATRRTAKATLLGRDLAFLSDVAALWTAPETINAQGLESGGVGGARWNHVGGNSQFIPASV